MLTIFIFMIIYVLFIVMLGVFSIYYTKILIKKIYTNNEAAIDYIINTGGVPVDWKNNGSKKKYLKNLSKLLKYARTNRLLNESDKKILVENLEEIFDGWKEWPETQF